MPDPEGSQGGAGTTRAAGAGGRREGGRLRLAGARASAGVRSAVALAGSRSELGGGGRGFCTPRVLEYDVEIAGREEP